jgi:hypothetical protein
MSKENKTEENAVSLQDATQAVVARLRDEATLTSTNAREGAATTEYWHVPIGAVTWLEELATLRGKESDYLSIITRAFDVKSKTIQTTIEKGDSSRKDTLTVDEKKTRFDKWISVLFTIAESEATSNKRVMSSMVELVKALTKAQSEGDAEAIASITADMAIAMTGGKA